MTAKRDPKEQNVILSSKIPEEGWLNRPIWEIVVEIGNSIPEESLAELPKDLSKNYRHYLYGLPKINF